MRSPIMVAERTRSFSITGLSFDRGSAGIPARMSAQREFFHKRAFARFAGKMPALQAKDSSPRQCKAGCDSALRNLIRSQRRTYRESETRDSRSELLSRAAQI